MTVVLFHHARVSVAEVLCDDKQGNAIHYRQRSPCVPKPMKADWRVYFGRGARFLHRPSLMRLSPGATCPVAKHRFGSRTSNHDASEKFHSLLSQDDMAALARLAVANGHGSDV